MPLNWKAQWPDYCQDCNGWGGHEESQSHPYGATSATEYWFETCGALPIDYCHRCNRPGLPRHGEGPCKYCGWNFDDGVPYDQDF